eukprot:1640349-Rhodomonas_salina.4
MRGEIQAKERERVNGNKQRDGPEIAGPGKEGLGGQRRDCEEEELEADEAAGVLEIMQGPDIVGNELQHILAVGCVAECLREQREELHDRILREQHRQARFQLRCCSVGRRVLTTEAILDDRGVGGVGLGLRLVSLWGFIGRRDWGEAEQDEALEGHEDR